MYIIMKDKTIGKVLKKCVLDGEKEFALVDKGDYFLFGLKPVKKGVKK